MKAFPAEKLELPVLLAIGKRTVMPVELVNAGIVEINAVTTILQRLAAKGLIDLVGIHNAGSGKPRRLYAATDYGLAVIKLAERFRLMGK